MAANETVSWMRARKDTKRQCLLCGALILKYDYYRRCPRPPSWEHYHCYQKLHVEAERRRQPAPKRERTARAVYGVHDAGENGAAGQGENFPGMSVQWNWLEPEGWEPYRLHVAGLAYRRRLFETTIGPQNMAALQQVASRLINQVLDPERLQEVCEDAEGEFDLPRGIVGYWFASLGVCLLGREWVLPEDVLRVEAIDPALVERILRSKQ